MGTAVIFNGFGQYEQTNDGQKGITLSHGGVQFWLPFKEVSYIPDFTMREVDHEASAGTKDTEGKLVYKTYRLSGERIAEELLEIQIPYTNSQKGIILISSSDPKKRKNSYKSVLAGFSEDGKRLMTDVQEVTPTDYEKEEAYRLARAYKEEIIQMYFQTKRERMAGGQGQMFPTGLIRTYMNELGIKDIDDVSKQIEAAAAAAAATPGVTGDQLLAVVRELLAAKPSTSPLIPPPASKSALTPEQAKSLV